MAWLSLLIAGVFEIISIGLLKKSNSFSHPAYTIGFVITAAFSYWFLTVAMNKNMPMGTAYAVWTGIGAVGTAIVGIVFFSESAAIWRLFFLFNIIFSITMLLLMEGRA